MFSENCSLRHTTWIYLPMISRSFPKSFLPFESVHLCFLHCHLRQLDQASAQDRYAAKPQ